MKFLAKNIENSIHSDLFLIPLLNINFYGFICEFYRFSISSLKLILEGYE